jgi:hypothetical protein
METPSIEYRGFKITHREVMEADSFHIEGDGWNTDKPTLKKTMEYIDRLLKQKFEKADVIMPRYGYRKENGEISEGTVTSVTEDGAVWVSYKKPTSFSTRTKISSEVYFDTPANRILVTKIFNIIKENAAHDAKIEQEISALKMKMTSPIPPKKRKESEE